MKWLLVFVTLFISAPIFGQADVMVINSKGKIWYQNSPQSAKKSLIPGQKIKAVGALLLDPNSQITLLSKGKTYQLSASGTHDLAILIPNESENKMGFGSRFWSFLTDGLINSDNQKSLDQYHKQHMSVAGGVKGFTGAERSLNSLLPSYGKLVPGIIEFQWTAHKDTDAVVYQFDITEAASNTLIYRALYQQSTVSVDLRHLALNDQQSYHWQVKALDKKTKSVIEPNASSEVFAFEFVLDPHPVIATALEDIEGFGEADEFSQSWMEAIAMEQEGFPYMAYRRYLKLKLTYPNNLLITKLFASFLVRQNQLEAASGLLNQ